MASSNDDSPAGTAPRRLVYEAQQRVQKARSKLWSELTREGKVSEDTRELLQWAVLNYYDVLHDHRENNDIEEQWQNAGPWDESLDALPRVVSSPKTGQSRTRGKRGVAEETTVEPRKLDPMTLYEISHDLQDIQNDLGLGVPAEEGLVEDQLEVAADE